MAKKTPSASSIAVNYQRDRRYLLGFLIHDISNLRKRIFDASFKQLNLNRTQWWTLGNLLVRGTDGMSQGELAKILDAKKAIMGVMIDQLEDAGFVRRVPEPQDRRVKRIKLTPKGRALADETNKITKAMAPRINEGISEEDLERTQTTLEAMRENLRKILTEQEQNGPSYETPPEKPVAPRRGQSKTVSTTPSGRSRKPKA